LRRATPALRRAEFFSPDDHTVRWLRLDGTPMTQDDWTDHAASTFLLRLDGDQALDVVFTGTSATVQTRR
jgi:pullulanase/glycogen debranching enzyme